MTLILAHPSCRARSTSPTPNRLVRHRHSGFRQQIFDVAQAEGEPEVKPYRLQNDLRREAIPVVSDLVHPRGATRPLKTPQARIAVTMPPGGKRQPLEWGRQRDDGSEGVANSDQIVGVHLILAEGDGRSLMPPKG